MKPGRIVALVFGCLAALIGIGLTIGTIFLGVVYGTQRDSDGYFSTGTVPMRLDDRRPALRRHRPRQRRGSRAVAVRRRRSGHRARAG